MVHAHTIIHTHCSCTLVCSASSFVNLTCSETHTRVSRASIALVSAASRCVCHQASQTRGCSVVFFPPTTQYRGLHHWTRAMRLRVGASPRAPYYRMCASHITMRTCQQCGRKVILVVELFSVKPIPSLVLYLLQ